MVVNAHMQFFTNASMHSAGLCSGCGLGKYLSLRATICSYYTTHPYPTMGTPQSQHITTCADGAAILKNIENNNILISFLNDIDPFGNAKEVGILLNDNALLRATLARLRCKK